MSELWRPIEGYEGLYEVSSYGRVRSLDRYVKTCYEAYKLQKGKILNPGKDKDGYLQVSLHCNGKQHQRKIHRLVAQAFIENFDNLPMINHKDEDKTNNRVDNLEWCTAKYNANYGTARIRGKETAIKNGYWTGLRSGLSEKEYRKKYYEENRDRICDRQRSYYQENKDKISDRQKKYSQDNKEKIREYHHQYYLKKKEEIQNNVKSLNDKV